MIDERIYTPQEVADLMHVKLRTVYDWIKKDKLKAFQVGRLWRISESELNRVMGKQEPAKKLWYAVLIDDSDNDHGTGSFDKAEALKIAKTMSAKKIAVIDPKDDFCLDVIDL